MMDITKMSGQEVAPTVYGLRQRCHMPTNKGCSRTQFFHAEQATCQRQKLFIEEC